MNALLKKRTWKIISIAITLIFISNYLSSNLMAQIALEKELTKNLQKSKADLIENSSRISGMEFPIYKEIMEELTDKIDKESFQLNEIYKLIIKTVFSTIERQRDYFGSSEQDFTVAANKLPSINLANSMITDSTLYRDAKRFFENLPGDYVNDDEMIKILFQEITSIYQNNKINSNSDSEGLYECSEYYPSRTGSIFFTLGVVTIVLGILTYSFFPDLGFNFYYPGGWQGGFDCGALDEPLRRCTYTTPYYTKPRTVFNPLWPFEILGGMIIAAWFLPDFLVSLLNDPPKATIASPQNGFSAYEGEPVAFEVSVDDLMLVDPSWCSWTSSIDGNMGCGLKFRKGDLSSGNHAIKVRCHDDYGLYDEATVNISINPANFHNYVVDSFDSPGPKPAGLAFDGTYLWCTVAGTENKMYRLDTLGNVSFSTDWIPEQQPRGIAFATFPFEDSTFSFLLAASVVINDQTNTSDFHYIHGIPVDLKNEPPFTDTHAFTIVPSWSDSAKLFGLAFDGTNIWGVDYSEDAIYKIKYSLENDTIEDFSNFNSPGTLPAGLAFDGTYLWHSDWDTRKIYQLTKEGNVVFSFDSPGPKPTGLTFDGTYLWCADAETNKIYKLDIY